MFTSDTHFWAYHPNYIRHSFQTGTIRWWGSNDPSHERTESK